MLPGTFVILGRTHSSSERSFNILGVQAAINFTNYTVLPKIFARCSDTELRYCYVEYSSHPQVKEYLDKEIRNRFSEELLR